MAPRALFDLSALDLDRVRYGVREIEAINPHRGCMRLLDGVIWHDESWSRALAFKDVGHDEFWAAGHIPGRPLFPGVLMVEAAAQLASFVIAQRLAEHGPRFIGFIGCDEVKFRTQVVPGERLLICAKEVKFGRRRFVCATQGWVNGNLCFEAKIKGMPI